MPTFQIPTEVSAKELPLAGFHLVWRMLFEVMYTAYKPEMSLSEDDRDATLADRTMKALGKVVVYLPMPFCGSLFDDKHWTPMLCVHWSKTGTQTRSA